MVSVSKQMKQTPKQTALLRGVEPVSWSRIKLAAKVQQMPLTQFVQGAAEVAATRVLGQFGKQAGQ